MAILRNPAARSAGVGDYAFAIDPASRGSSDGLPVDGNGWGSNLIVSSWNGSPGSAD
jgi:hypothetical protein